MENVSKALLIAGSIILGLILLSTLIYVLRLGGSVNKAYDERQINYQTEAYNYQFDIYQKDNNTISDMVTLLNLAYSSNSDNNYDLNNSILIELEIGNKKYRLPKDLSTNSETFYNNNFRALSRNQVYDENTKKVMSVYDLLEKNISELGISGVGLDSQDKLSKIHIGQYIYFPDRKVNDPKFGQPEIGSNGTTYKYVFDCLDDDMKYNNFTGRISVMKFKCKLNPYWELGQSGIEWD